MKARLLFSIVLFAGAKMAGAELRQAPPGYRPPVIAKVQLVFSMVAHHHHIKDRVDYYNTRGQPLGNHNYAVPMLVYEPLVTLYNPYNDNLVIENARIRVWDPPVGFRFKKNDVYLRSEWSSGEYHGIARFNVINERIPDARKTFTMTLGSMKPDGTFASRITLPPGGSAVFTARVEPQWTWGLETTEAYDPRSFFDWNPREDFTNQDPRSSNLFGVESVPGWDARAGFQTDHLSYARDKPPEIAYPFEGSHYGTSGWVTIKLTDSVSVESRPLRTVADSSAADFQVDLLAGEMEDATRDVYTKLIFDLGSLVDQSDDGAPSVSRTFTVGDILQAPADQTPGGKTPFAVFSVAARSDSLVRGNLETLGILDAGAAYDSRFDGVTDFAAVEAIGPLGPAAANTSVVGARREGERMIIDIVSPLKGGNWTAWGGETLDSMDEDLTHRSTIGEGPTGTGIYKALIDISGKGPKYFVRLQAR